MLPEPLMIFFFKKIGLDRLFFFRYPSWAGPRLRASFYISSYGARYCPERGARGLVLPPRVTWVVELAGVFVVEMPCFRRSIRHESRDLS